MERHQGELVFNTAMTGYQEILTDPSYARQIVTLTHPHIGNTGVNTEDVESDRLWLAGLVIRDMSPLASSWRSTATLGDYLKKHNTIAIAGIDTRRLTRLLRDKGALRGAITAGPGASAERSLELARQCPTLAGADLGKGSHLRQDLVLAAPSGAAAAGRCPGKTFACGCL